MSDLLFYTDGYKLDHRRQYPPHTQRVYANWTPRASRVPGQEVVVFFGLQYFLNQYMGVEFQRWLRRPEREVCDEYAKFLDVYLGPNDVGVEHIRALHKLGYMPLRFCALPEGTLTPLRVPIFTIENTHEDFFWLTNYWETQLSNVLWRACTSATTAYRYRQLLDAWALRTTGSTQGVEWQGHDFSYRGMSGLEDACLSSAAHLLSFTGTDCVPALKWIERYYAGENGLVGGSVPATEHSVMCAGSQAGEHETFERLLELYPRGIVSVVSDTWDLWHVLVHTLPDLHDKIMARDGKLVIRPDSGDPVDILCGTIRDGIERTPEQIGVVELLWDVFGGTINDHGFKVLDSHVGAIYGDSITPERAQAICERLADKGFASTNVVLGIGSYAYAYCTRDTYGFAVKSTAAKVAGEWRELFKDPVTDDGTKRSARGKLAVCRNKTGTLVLVDQLPAFDDGSHYRGDLLQPVWEDGHFLKRWSFEDVRRQLSWGAQKDGVLL